MAFVKLDRDILRSTIWFDREAREVFITALLLAEPKEFTEPIEQLEVTAIHPTGWSAPPGWYGFVAASGPGIVNAAQVPQAEGMSALVRLGAPEAESRTQTYDGRRLIRVDGGYVVLNYMKHRDKDHTSPMRSARYRERLRSRVVTVESQKHAVTSHTRVMPNPFALCDLSSDSPEGMQGEPKPKRAKASPKWRHVPEAWQPNEAHLAKVKALAWPASKLATELEKFRNWEFKTPKTDADKTFHTWILNADDSNPGRNTNGNRKPASIHQPNHGKTGWE